MATPDRPQDFSAHSNFDPIDETIQLHGIVDLLSELAKEDQSLAEASAKIGKKLDLPPIPDLVKQAEEHLDPAQNVQGAQVDQSGQVTVTQTLGEESLILPSDRPAQKQPESVVVATDKLNALLEEVSHLRDAQTNLTAHISELETQLKETENRSLEPASDRQEPTQSFLTRFGLIILLLLLLLIPVGIYQYFKLVERGREKSVELKLGSVPQLSVYRIDVDVRGNDLYLQGKLPHRHLRDMAAEVAAATLPRFKVNNEIIAIATPTDPVLVNAAALRIATAFSAIDGMNINAQLQGNEVILSGTAIRQQNIDALVPAFSQIPGVDVVTNKVKLTPTAIATRVYFGFESATVEPRDIEGKLLAVKQFLRQNPKFRLRIVGYAHKNEYLAEQLAQERAQAVKNILEDRGIDRRRMEAIAGDAAPPGVVDDQENWLSQAVLFELIEPSSEAE